MAKDMLLEIGLEEVPARFVRAAMEQLKEKTEKWLESSRLSHAGVQAYATPRRLAVLVSGLADKQEDVSEEVKGPARKVALDEAGNWSKAALGFARSQGLAPEELFFRELGGVEYVYGVKSSQGVETSSLLPEALPALVTSLTFPKNMRWGSYELRYVRPIRWLVALHGEDIVPFEITGVASGNVTRGHRFLGQDAVIGTPADYTAKLKEQHVIADVEERRQAIEAGIEALAAERGWHIAVKDDLLEEVLFLVETPTVLTGSFDPDFLAIPQEVLITSMREHQRYFPVLDGEGRLQPHFVTVRNGDSLALDVVAKGNEKVLRARLSDAKFFYEEDKKLVIADALAKLENIVYHEELGTVADKVRRIRAISDKLAGLLHADTAVAAKASRAADICKFDLVSQMVYEFPELQGIMGEDYAGMAGEDLEVAKAINEHYSPRNAGDQPPASLVGAIVGIADKIDTIAGCFSIGIIPTGSQDPYALRRQAAGIVSTLLAHGLELTLPELFDAALDVHAARGLKRDAAEIRRDMLEFFTLRVKNVLSEKGVRYDIVDAVLGAGAADVRRTLLRAEVLAAAAGEDGKDTLRKAVESFNRVCNLAAKADSREVNASLFAETAEADLHRAWELVHGRFVQAVSAAKLDEAFDLLGSLSEPITAFFDAVMVMADDEAVRRNRLALLANIAEDIKAFADFSKLVSK
ncbi:glycyl-tRNA synthetase beta chain [Paenibacillus sp. UNCCL117]|uniref:glycine--tRNA ligase subunit beta n=1 Tax=unclassified Paenibacillus TaxID=185978 RepID=UPI000891030C|nr:MULTISPECIES: glycine--tRNA ligase subunit beta [unclassified Paenibacillus]SDC92400.1 glycyl-tRNA synthetase beta chain [Paenibacillus sp. cl123]SFW29333.1 glycyl-tRNA synthetase beta chain [Paenibacillus sp. UNCCL117]